MKNQTHVAPSLPEAVDPSTLLSRLSEKDRLNFDKQVAACEGQGVAGLASRWRRLALALMTWAPGATKLSGSDTIQFYIPDGKYRKQVYAMHTAAGGAVMVYARNVLDVAVRQGVLAKPRKADGPDSYRLAGSEEALTINAFDGKTPNPEFFYKDMTGWNRKAIGITLPPTASEAQVQAVEDLCALAAPELAAVAKA
ncbi:MAG: hypothetical protein PHU85_02870 [Phycisphaerae bacterium]|nr:hypothetical protein [Phycisphaerae bacterium]